MIKSKNRSGWFGASDTKFIMSNWDTKTFMDWWQTKLGIMNKDFQSLAMVTGTYQEHKIAQYYGVKNNVKIKLDRQIKLRKLKLRVNLDCETKYKIVEIKTHKKAEGEWKMPKEYSWQVQVQMFATRKKSGCIYVYALIEDDYNNFYLPIDDERISEIEVKYDEKWINEEYLPRLEYLCFCLRNKKTPKQNEFKEIKNAN